MNNNLQTRCESQKVDSVIPVLPSRFRGCRKDNFLSNTTPNAKQSTRSLQESDFSKKLKIAMARVNASSTSNATEVAMYRGESTMRCSLHDKGVDSSVECTTSRTHLIYPTSSTMQTSSMFGSLADSFTYQTT